MAWTLGREGKEVAGGSAVMEITGTLRTVLELGLGITTDDVVIIRGLADAAATREGNEGLAVSEGVGDKVD